MADIGAEPTATLDTLPDDAFEDVFAACSDVGGLASFEEVMGLGCLSKGMQQQLQRLRPLVGVQSLIALQRSTWPCNAAFRPWRVALLYKVPCGRSVSDSDMEAILSFARQGCVHSICASCPLASCERGFHCDDCKNADSPLTLKSRLPRMVPKLLGAGSSLLELDFSFMPNMKGTWASNFGEAAMCSPVLRKLRVTGEGGSSGLRGPLPELRLPALQELDMRQNKFTGGLEPLQFCTKLQTLRLSRNLLKGGLEPLQNCTGLQTLDLSHNLSLTGDLEPLQGCTALKVLRLHFNQLTGTLEPLRDCTALRQLYLDCNHLVPTEKDIAHFNRIMPPLRHSNGNILTFSFTCTCTSPYTFA